MELITYRKTLDVHKNGSQFLLQGFQTADNISRCIEISLMASGDAIDFPLERIVAMMYVTTPNAKEPSIIECTIKDNKVVYNVLPIVEEGITTMQLKLIEISPDGAKSVLASPKFSVEVSKSDADDGGVEQTTTFSALENAMAKAIATYNARLLRAEMDDNCVFKAYYNDGTIYETDAVRQMVLSVTTDMDLTSLVKSGLTSFTADEVADKVLEDVSGTINLNTGNSKYATDLLSKFEKPVFVSWDALTSNTPFTENLTTETSGFAFVYGDIESNHIVVAYANNSNENFCHIHSVINGESKGWTGKVSLKNGVKDVLPIENGGTGSTTIDEMLEKFGIIDYVNKYQRPWNVEKNIGSISDDNFSVSCTHDNEETTTISKEEKAKIYMKNSGQLWLRFHPFVYVSENDDNAPSYCEATVYKNDTPIKTYTYGENGEHGSIDDLYYSENSRDELRIYHTVLLDVTKEDIVSVGVKCSKSLKDHDATFKVDKIEFFANVETPFVYSSLRDSGLNDFEIENN